MRHRLVSLFFGIMAFLGGAGTLFIYLLFSTVVCESLDGNFIVCTTTTWIFVLFSFSVIVVLPAFIAFRTWK